MKRKSVYIIAGPNGSGKTTFANLFLPNYVECQNFINADLIARGLAPFNAPSMAFKAGRLVLQQIDDYVHAKSTDNHDEVIEDELFAKIQKTVR